MANKIAKVAALEDIIKYRHLKTKTGKVEIGHFWSILRIYKCMELGVSLNTLCEVASMIDGRLDHNYNKTTRRINPESARKWVQLKSMPKHIGHTVRTKTVSAGELDHEKLKQVLIKHNSYGDEIMRDIMAVSRATKGKFLSERASTFGAGDFNSVLTIANAILGLHKYGKLDMSNVSPQDHKDYIIKTISNSYNDGDIDLDLPQF